MENEELGYVDENKDYSTIIFYGVMCLTAIIILITLDATKYALIPIFIFFGGIYAVSSGNDTYKRNQMIKQHGIKVEGTIIDIDCYLTSKTSAQVNYSLIVQYTNPYTGVNEVYQTPLINFNPIEVLGSKTCTVYIYNKYIYVTDFVRRYINEPIIWSQDYIESKNAVNVVKNNLIYLIKTILLAAIVFTIEGIILITFF